MKSIYNLLFVVYLFCYVQISPALQYNYENYDDSNQINTIDYNGVKNSEFNEYEIDKRSAEVDVPLSLNKRFIPGGVLTFVGGIVTKAAINVIGKQLGRFINRAFGRSAAFITKQSAIEQTINHDYDFAVAFRNEVAKIDPEAARAIVINKNGFNCDEDYCSQYGNGPHSIGLCTPEICHCSDGYARIQTCRKGMVFDPVNKNCNYPHFVKVCGA